MTIIKHVKKWLGGGTAQPAGHHLSTLIYVSTIVEGEGRGQDPAQDQLLILRRLAAMATREKTPITVLFMTRPLRKAADGATQDGVTVRYVTTKTLLTGVVADLVQKVRPRSAAVVITDFVEIEKEVASLGGSCMRLRSFHKALEGLFGPLRPDAPRRQRSDQDRQDRPERQDRPAGHRPEGRPDSRPAHRPPRSVEPEAQPAAPSETAPDAAPSDAPAPTPKPAPAPSRRPDPNAERDPVLDLIDPL
jgi:hypothetical protein